MAWYGFTGSNGLRHIKQLFNGRLYGVISRMPGRSANSSERLGDRLVRRRAGQHKLDPELVKSYAVDFCGTKTLRDASREQVENFVQQLADWAEKDRNALLCQLNSYVHLKQEVVA